jgi:flagellin-like hook-associated protein FlgL
MRANNAIDITAAVAGTKFENTDVVYVKATADFFSETFRFGYQNVYFTSDVAATLGLGVITMNFNPAGSGSTTATLAGSVLTVNINEGDDLAGVIAAIRANTALIDFDIVDPTGSPVDRTRSAAALYNKTLTLNNVQLAYSDTPAAAAATITLNTGTGDVVKMRIVADKVGTDLNDVKIVFEQDDTFKAGDVSAVYDAERKILHIRGQVDNADATLNASFGTLKAAIEANSPFRVDITTMHDNKAYALSNRLVSGLSDSTSGNITGLIGDTGSGAYIKTGQYVGDVGGQNQTLFITVAADATANDVVWAFNNAKGASAQIAANFIVNKSLDNNGSGVIFNSIFDKDNVRVFIAALTGGNSGLNTAVTANDLIKFINNDAILSKLFIAERALGQTGSGFLTLFDEAAYYGSTIDDNALQFLGPNGSPNILFVIDGPNSELGISFVDSYGTGCISDDRPIASLNATNENAAFSVQALTGGSEYDDMVVRLIHLSNNSTVEESYAQYVSGPSNAMAYCSINNNPNTTGTTEETGKFIIYANQQGERYNNVDIVVKLDINQSDPAMAYYDEATKKLIVTIRDGETTLGEAMAAINNEGTFRAEFDYSFNGSPSDISTGAGLEKFSVLLNTGVQEAVIGNTGNTGGHKGGVLNVFIGGDNDQATAQVAIDAINKGSMTGSRFVANAIGGTDAGTGLIDFRNDNIRQVVGSDGKTRNEVNMLTGILGSDNNAVSYMVVHLATDKYGNSITTAADLVKFFDQLTAEQTRGISVSVVRPAGVDNLDRVWTYDNCGNIIETQFCNLPYGLGLLQPTYKVDECDVYTYFPIEFFSYGQDIKAGNAYGSVIAQGGIDASLDIRAKAQGPDYNGVGLKYVKLSNPLAEVYAEYDANNKTIIVHIHEGATTASQVKSAIENSEGTKNLFTVALPGNGSGFVSLQDNYLLLKDGLYDAGYRGGATMLGNADADAHRLIIESFGEGSRSYVRVNWINGGKFDVSDVNGNKVDTAHGTDMIATINGMMAKADGRDLSLSSAMLKLNMILDYDVTTGDQINFTITGGGAVVQMGPKVVSNQQIRFGIQSMTTAHLGGASGKLYQLREGGIADLLTSDASRRLADRIINEAISRVAQTRGRLGSIQKNTLEPQTEALQDSLVAISSAEAQISNADFAEETSRLTRAQILVQAGTRTLSLANQFPQYAASLLGG